MKLARTITITITIAMMGGMASAAMPIQTKLPTAHVVTATINQPVLAWFGWFKRDKSESADAKDDAAKAAELRKLAEDALKLISSKRSELTQAAAALQQIPVTQQISPRAREYQAHVRTLTGEIDQLRQQAEGYIDQLKAMGVPVDNLVASLTDALATDDN